MRKTKLRPISKKRAVQNRKYLLLREGYLDLNPWCQIHAPGCNLVARQIHHRMGRGKYLNTTKYWFATCWNCHDYVETHKREARKKGWILYK